MLLARSGDCIGNYRLLHKIGTGGMGVVFAAEHVLLGRRAALKFLRPEVSTEAQAVERFFTEARAASAVRHPGIVEVYDFGQHEGMAYLVMEHLEGESLRSCLKAEGRLPAARASHIGMHIASALDAAHGAGVVHRDLKPDNVFLARGLPPDPARPTGGFPVGERVCILDFGVAKLLHGDGSWSPSITTSDIVVGTPTFMSPEQCRGGGNVDGRSDLYALGCILYATVCGRPPFLGAGGGDVLAQHIYAAPDPPSWHASELPAELEQIILRLLEKDPARRFQSAREAARALRAVSLGTTAAGASGSSGQLPAGASGSFGSSAGAPLAAPRRSRAVLLAVGGVLLAAGIGTAVALTTGGAAGSGESTAPREVAGSPATDPGAAAASSAREPAGGDEPAAATADSAATDPTATDTDPTGAADRLVELVIESTPSGAAVHRASDGQHLGRTPYRVRQESQEGYATYELRLEGYQPEQVSVRADTSAQAVASLRPARGGRPERARRSGGSSSLKSTR